MFLYVVPDASGGFFLCGDTYIREAPQRFLQFEIKGLCEGFVLG